MFTNKGKRHKWYDKSRTQTNKNVTKGDTNKFIIIIQNVTHLHLDLRLLPRLLKLYNVVVILVIDCRRWPTSQNWTRLREILFSLKNRHVFFCLTLSLFDSLLLEKKTAYNSCEELCIEEELNIAYQLEYKCVRHIFVLYFLEYQHTHT